MPVPFSEGRAAGQQPSSVAGARGSGTAGARARPNVEVNRRAEGTSELNRRLGAGVKGDWALERCGAAGDYGRAVQESKRCVPSAQKAKQQASNLAAPPEHAEVEQQEPERGLTPELSGSSNREAIGLSA